MELVRAAALTGYCQTMEALGADPRPLLREAGLSQQILLRSEQLISARTATRLLERGAALTTCVTFGLRMAERRELANLGAPSLLIAHQPTLRAALSALVRYRNHINSSLILDVDEIGDAAVIRGDFSVSSGEASRQASDLARGVLAHLCGAVLGESWRPELVCFTGAPLPLRNCPFIIGCSAAAPSSMRNSTASLLLRGILIAPTQEPTAHWPNKPAGSSTPP